MLLYLHGRTHKTMERALSFTKGRTQVQYGSKIGYDGVYHHSQIPDETSFEHGRHRNDLQTIMALQKRFQVEKSRKPHNSIYF